MYDHKVLCLGVLVIELKRVVILPLVSPKVRYKIVRQMHVFLMFTFMGTLQMVSKLK